MTKKSTTVEALQRQLDIEAALERVRARSMGMQSSDELSDVLSVLFQQFDLLGIHPKTAWLILWNPEKNTFTYRSTGTSGKRIQGHQVLDIDGMDIWRDLYEKWKTDTSASVEVLFYAKEDLAQLFSLLEETYSAMPEEERLTPDHFPEGGYSVQGHCKFGYIGYTHTREPSEEDKAILTRFATEFGRVYQRFLDIEKAEAQARESRIETALERVRARALAMQQPEELKEVVQVLRQEMGLLGIEELETSSIYINDEEIEKAECWFAIKDLREKEKGMVTDHFALDLKDTWVGREMLKFYKAPEDKVSIVMKGEARKEWIDYCEARSKALKGYYGEVIPERTYHLHKFSHGAIGAATPGDLSGESWKLLQRAASVFSLAYSRFKDLTQARLDLQRLKEEKQRAEDALKELQLTQQQLVHAEKMASLGELTAGIAHEIQNPLNFVNNFSDVSRELLEELLEEMEKGDAEEVDAIARDVIQNLEKIVHHGKRADSIVKGMLQHSRSGEGKKEPTDLNALADEYLRLAYHGLRAKDKSFNAAMETDFTPDLPEVSVVPQDIGRVLLNLITNAFHAIDERNQKGEQGYKPTVRISTRKSTDGVEISVRDNGGGIPENIRDKIFQPFFTTKPTGEGTGLGLSMSYDIVNKGHGGQLTVHSNAGEGTDFLITLPV